MRQSADVASVRRQLLEIERLRGAARIELGTLKTRQTELKRHKKTVTSKLTEARQLLGRLTTEDRARLDTTGGGAGHVSRSSASSRRTLTGPVSPATADAPDSRAAAAVSYAYSKLGSPYVWGATGPNAFDCSGLTLAAYRAARRLPPSHHLLPDQRRSPRRPLRTPPRRPRLLLLRHQPRGHLHRQRPDDPRPKPLGPGTRGTPR